MLGATIGDINKGFKFPKELGLMLYVVADVSQNHGRCVFYVGQTRSGVSERLCRHVNTPTKLGWLIRANWPQSLTWQVQAYEPREVLPGGMRDKSTLLKAEQILIEFFCPPLNIMLNKNPRPLPTRYRKDLALISRQ